MAGGGKGQLSLVDGRVVRSVSIGERSATQDGNYSGDTTMASMVYDDSFAAPPSARAATGSRATSRGRGRNGKKARRGSARKGILQAPDGSRPTVSGPCPPFITLPPHPLPGEVSWIAQSCASLSRRAKLRRVLQPVYCYCEQVSSGDMLGCDNEYCPREWVRARTSCLLAGPLLLTCLTPHLLQFHLQCVGLQHAPAGSWWCRDCALEYGILKR